MDFLKFICDRAASKKAPPWVFCDADAKTVTLAAKKAMDLA